jgi:antitoxin VapB
MKKTAKLFRNGRSQAVRLPAEFRFEGTEVYIRRDQDSGDVILSSRSKSWQELFDFLDRADIPDDFMADRKDPAPGKRKVL